MKMQSSVTTLLCVRDIGEIRAVVRDCATNLLPCLHKDMLLPNRTYYVQKHNDVAINMLVLINAGEFIVGDMWGDGYRDERPCKNVLMDDYLIAIFPTTNAMFCYWLRTRDSQSKTERYPDFHVLDGYTRFFLDNDKYTPFAGFEHKPVVTVTWYGAQRFCNFFQGYLPSELQWEKAASWDVDRQTKKRFPYGNRERKTYMSCEGDFSIPSYEKLLPRVDDLVKGISPNGLLHCSGTVWEWCSNDYDPRLYHSLKVKLSNKPTQKAIRGGGWAYGIHLARTTNRGRDYSTNGEMTNGFRYCTDFKRLRTLTKHYRPEPTLHESEYRDILNVLHSMAMVIERNPAAFASLDEAAIRTHFLVHLNAHYKGGATAETFNASGKTDILIRAKDRNVFIAECKFWRGPKAFNEAISQLLGYLSWRDTKCAIMIFNQTKGSSAVRQKMHQAMENRAEHRKTVSHDPDGDSRYIFVKESDPSREITITTQLYDIPQEDQKQD